jgi:hypothetical protein
MVIPVCIEFLKIKFAESILMAYSVEDLEDQKRFRLFLRISYKELIEFVFEYLKKKSGFMFIYWSLCSIFAVLTITIRIGIAGNFPESQIFFHTAIGLIILPLLCIPVHEFLHAVPFWLSGAKNIRVGMDLKQYLFYVTAHRYVATSLQFWIVALTPLLAISSGLILSIIFLPGLWKWSLSLFLFVHATMCAGDIAFLNLYFLNRNKRLYTWDDVDKKEAYFYEKISL